ncbi:MAG: lysophospholipase, partial [Gemmataceae bacterium]|nr:lysophospholipase [Gemmataceae bacterium]
MFIHAAAAASWLFPPRPASPLWQPLRSYVLFGAGVPSTVRDEWWKRTADVPMQVLGHRVRLVRSLDLRPAVGRIRVPTWILAALDDRLVPAVAGRWLAAAIRGCRLWQPRVGHAALVHPDVDIEKWLRSSDELDGTVRTTRCSIDYKDPGPNENTGVLVGPGGHRSKASTGEKTCNDSQRW